MSRRAIVDAALAIIDTEGLDRLTMRRVAAALDTGPASLYRHISGMQELHTFVVDEFFAGADLGPPSDDWRADLGRAARGLRGLLAARPSATVLLIQVPLVGPNANRGHREIMEMLRRGGFDEAEAFAAYRAIARYTIGHLVLANGRRNSDADAGPDGIPRFDSDEDFEFGLDALIRGMCPRGEATG